MAGAQKSTCCVASFELRISLRPQLSFANHALPSEGPALNKDQLPEVLAGTLDHIVGQLDMMTRTLAILDKRLSLQEDMMAQQINKEAESKMSRIESSGGVEQPQF